MQLGKKFEPEDGRVLGVAADMKRGELLFGLDGDWNEPMGVAFTDINTSSILYPALSASDLKLEVNFGDRAFIHGPPDTSFIGIIYATRKLNS